MDLKGYYRKLKELESGMDQTDVYVMSLATPDGGREGVITHAPKRVACQMVLEGKARFATAEEAEMFEMEQAEQREALAEADYNSRIHVHLVTGSDTPARGKKN